MRHPVLNAEFPKLPIGALLACALAVLLFAMPSSAAAQEHGEDVAASSEGALLAVCETGIGGLGVQALGKPIASGVNGTCVWEIDANGKLTIEPADGVSGTMGFYNPVYPDTDTVTSMDWRADWYPHAASITSAEVKGTVYLEGKGSRLFEGCKNLVEVDLSGLDTSRMHILSCMFADCQKLVSVDVSMLDTSCVESLYRISYPKGCTKVGAYKVTVSGKGAYKSQAQEGFTVVPATPRLQSVRAHKNSDGSSGFIVTWEKAGKAAVGYQVCWSPNPSLAKAASFAFEGSTQYAKKGEVALRVRTKSWLGKTMCVKMRAFQTVSGKTYYSGWSAAKRVKLKR